MGGLQSLHVSATQTAQSLNAVTSAASGATSAINALPSIDPKLAKLLSFEGVSSGGPLEYSGALDIVKSYIEDFTKNEGLSFAELQRRGIDPALREQERRKDIDYFAKAFGDKFGTLDDIARKLYEYQKAADAQSANGFTPASEERLSKTVVDTVQKSTGAIAVRLGGYLVTMQEALRKLEAEREALKRDREQLARQEPGASGSRTSKLQPAPAPQIIPINIVFRAGGLS